MARVLTRVLIPVALLGSAWLAVGPGSEMTMQIDTLARACKAGRSLVFTIKDGARRRVVGCDAFRASSRSPYYRTRITLAPMGTARVSATLLSRSNDTLSAVAVQIPLSPGHRYQLFVRIAEPPDDPERTMEGITSFLSAPVRGTGAEDRGRTSVERMYVYWSRFSLRDPAIP